MEQSTTDTEFGHRKIIRLLLGFSGGKLKLSLTEDAKLKAAKGFIIEIHMYNFSEKTIIDNNIKLARVHDCSFCARVGRLF